MIAGVKGTVFKITPGEVWVDTGNGFIVQVLVPVSSFSRLKNENEIFLHTVLRQKEEASYLYGFLSVKEKIFFEKMISISGVGGKTALSFISAFSIQELTEAINNGDVVKLISIPGIGRKTAQRIILELTGKLDLGEEQPDDQRVKMREDLVSGMVNLGFTQRGISGIVERILKENPEDASFEILFKQILRQTRKT